MGFFGGGYDKPGKGIDKDAPKKKGFFLYWDIVFRKFWKLLGLNAMYALTSIIWIALVYTIAPFNSVNLAPLAEILKEGGSADPNIIPLMVFGFRAMFALAVLLLWGSGPVSASYAYILRCFTREEHAWIMSDGRDKFKENFKQAIVVSIVDIVVLLLGMNAVYFYFTLYSSTQSILWMLLCYVMVMLFIVYTMMHFYIYQLMVTFECSIVKLYKNAVIFALGKAPMNLLYIAITLLAVFFSFTLFSPAIAIIFLVILGPMITRFPIEFYAARTIAKSTVDAGSKKSAKIEYLEDNADV